MKSLSSLAFIKNDFVTESPVDEVYCEPSCFHLRCRGYQKLAFLELLVAVDKVRL